MAEMAGCASLSSPTSLVRIRNILAVKGWKSKNLLNLPTIKGKSKNDKPKMPPNTQIKTLKIDFGGETLLHFTIFQQPASRLGADMFIIAGKILFQRNLWYNPSQLDRRKQTSFPFYTE
jgi:hypothetical protein